LKYDQRIPTLGIASKIETPCLKLAGKNNLATSPALASPSWIRVGKNFKETDDTRYFN
jgi:hypothetical protein